MLRIRPFQGLRPAPQLAPQVACVPYDVVDRDEAAALAAGNPLSLLHVDRAEIDLPPETDPYSETVYAKALENFRNLQAGGALIRETARVVYLYQQVMGGHAQTGIAALCHIDDYENNLIKKHEKTRKDKEDDRTRLIATLSADTGPVFLTYRDVPAIDRIIAEGKRNAPLYDFTAPDGIRHTVWRIEHAGDLVREFGGVPCSYVADGHHRTASAVRVGRERRAANPGHNGSEDYNWFLAVLFPASQLRILPYNRCVRDLNGRGTEDFLAALKTAGFSLGDAGDQTPPGPGEVRMYLDGKWSRLAWTPNPQADPIARLDVTVLQERLLAPLLGIDDPRTSKRIDFIGGIRGTGELERRVREGRAAVAFSMYPTTVDQLMDIADAGAIMPPKSTWFEPKLRSGLFIHTF
ncbi:MAG TPA: DUF1015 family protein [Chthoniobacteraceae bacterium]|jgi:uncharacterized protein (DUF1015 family)|nr:DUF1015 family protein [Chthoniobacteraceae bacterium]